MLSAVCTCPMSRPVRRARTLACGSASAITVPPVVLASLEPISWMRVSSFCDCTADASSALSLWNCWQNSRALLPATSVHSLRHDPGALCLDHVELGGDGVGRPVRRDPGELLLSALGVRAQVGVVGRLHRALAGGVQAIERGMAERRGHGVGADHDPHEGCCQGLRPRTVAHGCEEEERHQRLEAVGSRRCRAIDLAVQVGLAETESEPVVHGGRHDEQNAGRDHP